MSEDSKSSYYVPAPSYWPIVGSIALLCLGVGAANWVQGKTIGPWLSLVGGLILIYMLFGWFGTIIKEHREGKLDNPQVRISYRWGVIWFIFSEIMLFVALFGALFYARVISVPQLGGAGSGAMTHLLNWPSFTATWPLLHNPNPAQFPGALKAMEVWGSPAINTLIILLSGVCITIAYWGVLKNRRKQMIIFQALTILLALAFLYMQVHEYWMAYTVNGVKLTSGIYGSTFFMMTGLDGLHVAAGAIMLTVILWRMIKGDFSPKNHFAFDAVFWYWHFVEFIWIMLFIFVYWV